MKKSTTHIPLMNGDGEVRWVSAHGYHWEWEGFTFVIHRPVDPNDLGNQPFKSKGWVMTETNTGAKVSALPCTTRDDLISYMTDKLNLNGVDKFSRLVAANLNKRRDALQNKG